MRTTLGLSVLTVALPLAAHAQPQPQSPTPEQPAPAPAADPPPVAGEPEPAPAPVPPPAIAPVAVVETSATPAEPEPAQGSGFIAGAKLGGIVPLSGLSPFVHVGIELGYALPPMNRQLAIILGVDYTQPTATSEEMDPRVMGGTYTWKLTEQELGVMVTLVFRATSVKPVIPYGGIGPRILFTRSRVHDNGGPSISSTEEQSTKIGVGVPLGVELPLGPGRATGELLLQYGTLDHVATGDAHSGALTLAVGYRLVL